MDVSKLIRDPARVHKALQVTPDGKLVAKQEVKLYIPSRFTEHYLAEIGSTVYIAAIYGMVVEGTYFASSTVNAMMEITPSSMVTILVDGDEYLEFTFDAGAVITPSLKLVKNKPFVFQIYDEFFAKGRVPWYLGYLQMGRIFDTAKKHAGANIGGSHEITELLNSIVARSAKDRHLYYRSTVKSLDDLVKNPPAYIPMRSVQYAATNTLNKLAGSYFNEGVVSALVTPSSRQERIENLLTR